MNKEVNTPNIVVDDNYLMLVNRLTRRYAERGASVYTDAEAIEQERSDARARAIAPDAYRISRTMGDNPEMYKSGEEKGKRYMTTDDYLVYFSKCHDTFDAVNYYNLHAETSAEETAEQGKPRVLVNRKRMEMAKRSAAARTTEERIKNASNAENTEHAERRTARPERSEDRRAARPVHIEDHREEMPANNHGKRKAFTALAAAAASLALVVGSMFAFLPANEANYPENLSEEDAIQVASHEGQDILKNIE